MACFTWSKHKSSSKTKLRFRVNILSSQKASGICAPTRHWCLTNISGSTEKFGWRKFSHVVPCVLSMLLFLFHVPCCSMFSVCSCSCSMFPHVVQCVLSMFLFHVFSFYSMCYQYVPVPVLFFLMLFHVFSVCSCSMFHVPCCSMFAVCSCGSCQRTASTTGRHS